MTDTERYVLSFTAASLFIPESLKLAKLFFDLKEWPKVKEMVLSENILQSRTESRSRRIFQELSKRIEILSGKQLKLLIEGNYQEQKHLLWFSVCKCYAFIREFAIEVLHEKFLAMDYHLTTTDYEAFFNRKADWHEELNTISETTRKKLKQVIFRMLREAELLTKGKTIIQAIFTDRLIETLREDAPVSFLVFPIASPELFEGRRP